MNKTINFKLIDWYAKRAATAYQSEVKIRTAYPNTTLVATSTRDVQYFIENNQEEKKQIVVIRGTNNLANVREDSEYVQSRNNKLDIFTHGGFDEDTYEIFQNILPHIDKSNEIIVTGHSLGAAISTLLMMYLHEEGFNVGLSINFGQPKLTNKKGAEKYAFLPLTRVVDENDLVPLVPPLDLIDAIHGGYEHLGDEVILLEGPYYVYQNEATARKASLGSFWKNLGKESVEAHRMTNYLRNVESKFNNSSEVSFEDREKYYDL